MSQQMDIQASRRQIRAGIYSGLCIPAEAVFTELMAHHDEIETPAATSNIRLNV